MQFLLALLLAVFLFAPSAMFAQRQTVDLPDHWRFIRHDAAPDAVIGPDWQEVTVPHCWNALDGQNGRGADGGYYRGPAWYARAIELPADWKDKRVFIRFEAAFLVAEVYLNGQRLGEHRGGFAAFCLELTPHLRFDGAPNELRVRLDNARNADVIPLSADFTMEGGIYRPVRLIATGQTCITPLDYGGPGVHATTLRVGANDAEVEIEIKLAAVGSGEVPAGQEPWKLHIAIRDAGGKEVAAAVDDATVSIPVKQRLHVPRPHLWNGVLDPYLYSVKVELRSGGGEAAADAVSVPLGLRTVEISREKGFLLNGQPYPIYGVNRHQEKKDKGWALSEADHDEDFAIMREMGVTAVRMAHYQQADNVLDLADRNGLLVWQEIPNVDLINTTPAFTDNCKQQLTEMIRQGSNHPAIFTWSVFNELVHPKSPPPEALVTELNRLARELDPTRTPSCASCRPDLPALDRIAEWIGFNIYPGWYVGTADDFGPPEDFGRNVRKSVAAAGGDKRVAISEYGAGANPAQHQEGALAQVKPGGRFHPEEWQTHVHEIAWSQARNNPDLWGTFVWTMFDFAVDDRNEGSTPGINDKGLVTEDRRIRKDAFYFYKANWNPAAIAYLASRRMTPRKLANTEVKAYSNCEMVELKINGQSLGATRPDEIHVCRWPGATLVPGVNRIEIIGRCVGSPPVTDQCEWTLQTP